jgi:hypothetical protein
MTQSITPYEVREHVKRLAHGKGADGAELVMLMHYERSREAWTAARRWGHPSWATYAGAYAAQPDTARMWGEGVAAELRRRFPGEESRHLPDGRSEWLP